MGQLLSFKTDKEVFLYILHSNICEVFTNVFTINFKYCLAIVNGLEVI